MKKLKGGDCWLNVLQTSVESDDDKKLLAPEWSDLDTQIFIDDTTHNRMTIQWCFTISRVNRKLEMFSKKKIEISNWEEQHYLETDPKPIDWVKWFIIMRWPCLFRSSLRDLWISQSHSWKANRAKVDQNILRLISTTLCWEEWNDLTQDDDKSNFPISMACK